MPAQSSLALRQRSPHPSPPAAPLARARLSSAHEWCVYATFAALVVTGCGWLLCHYVLAEAGEFGPLPHPLEGLWLQLHGAAGMIALVLFGSLLPSHMLRAWSSRRGRASGGTLAGLFMLLTVTATASTTLAASRCDSGSASSTGPLDSGSRFCSRRMSTRCVRSCEPSALIDAAVSRAFVTAEGAAGLFC